jgi:hypothetical protein
VLTLPHHCGARVSAVGVSIHVVVGELGAVRLGYRPVGLGIGPVHRCGSTRLEGRVVLPVVENERRLVASSRSSRVQIGTRKRCREAIGGRAVVTKEQHVHLAVPGFM